MRHTGARGVFGDMLLIVVIKCAEPCLWIWFFACKADFDEHGLLINGETQEEEMICRDVWKVMR